MINKKLKNYIENNIFPSYKKNDSGHNLEHINYVIERGLEFAKKVEGINYDMVYTVCAYHDIGHYIDAKNHEKISSEILAKDEKLKEFFTNEQIDIMKDAVYDHRASMNSEPRNIYGKIVSSADRNTSVESIIKRTYAYRKKHNPEFSTDTIIEESRKHLVDKFGIEGYATKKMFFKDIEYEKYLNDIAVLTSDKEKFRIEYMRINKINS